MSTIQQSNALSNAAILNKLFSARKTKEVEALISELTSRYNFKWVPVGGRPNNAGNIDVARDAPAPIVERITNSIDAMLELKKSGNCSSPRQAVESWFGIPGGRLGNLSRDQIQTLANNIEIAFWDSGDDKAPTITISDRGIGRPPSQFSSTLLSLGESNKVNKHYLCGAYGQGGSSTFAWCDYTIIISRAQPGTCNAEDSIGWTIVRRFDSAEFKTYMYQYLVTSTETIPSMNHACLEELNSITFDYGTYICHVSYRLDPYHGPVSRVGWRLFHNLLFDPLLPFWLREERHGYDKQRWSVSGNVARLRRDAQKVEYSNEFVKTFGKDEHLTIKYWVLEKKQPDSSEETYLDSFLEKASSPKTIIITLNGQRHDTLEKNFVREMGLSFLSDSLLIQVECDDLPLSMKKDLFSAHRGFVRESSSLVLIRETVAEALKTDKTLEDLEEQRRIDQRTTLDADSERRVRKMLDKLITLSRMTEARSTGSEPGEPSFNDPPTLLKIDSDEKVIEIPQGRRKEVFFVTDAPDDIFVREQNRAKLETDFMKSSGITAVVGPFKRGQIAIYVHVPDKVAIGTTDKLRLTLSMQTLASPLATSVRVVVTEPPIPRVYVSQDPPTIFEFSSKKHPVELSRGNRTSVTIVVNGPDDILRRHQSPAKFSASCSMPQTEIPDRRGPKNGKMQVYVFVPKSLETGTTGVLNAQLELQNGTVMKTEASCVVIEPKLPPDDRRKGLIRRDEPNYEIVPVNKSQWPDYKWNEHNVGDFNISGKTRRLYLLVNLDHDSLLDDLDKRTKRGETQGHILSIRNKYLVHVGYHIFQQFENDKSLGPTNQTSSGESRNMELRRVAKTVLQVMTAERDLS
ncbi:MAG: hypothetical protein ACLPY5_03975 [Candidatus Bathyarchaeia archaeon]